MKFLVTELQTAADGSMSSPSYAYDDILSAQAKYHTILAAAAKSPVPVHAAIIMNNEGQEIDHYCFYHNTQSEVQNE